MYNDGQYWHEVFFIGNTIHKKIKSEKDAIDHIKATYKKEYGSCEFVRENNDIYALLPDNRIVMSINHGKRPK